MKYSILIIAIDCHFSHMTRFVSNLKQINPEVEIHFFTNIKMEEIPEDITNNVVELIHEPSYKECGKWMKLYKKANSLKKHFKRMSKQYKYDIINIQFPHFYMAASMRYLRKMTKNIVYTPWGSDVLRVDGIRFKILMNQVLKKCDYITTTVDGNIGKKILNYLPSCRGKFRPMAWGSETIDFIDHHISEVDAQTAKERFGISDKYVITCGYNAFRAQNHEKIIDAIALIRSRLPDNLILLFPVSYGNPGKENYVQKLRKKCCESNLDALFIDEYMSVENVFYLRMATDLFVHVQNTDAGCASVQEYLLCDKKVVHGNWIHYKMLEAYPPLCYYPASDFNVLGEVIMEAYHSEGIRIAPEVLEYIRSNGWEVRRKEWNDFFSRIAAKS